MMLHIKGFVLPARSPHPKVENVTVTVSNELRCQGCRSLCVWDPGAHFHPQIVPAEEVSMDSNRMLESLQFFDKFKILVTTSNLHL